MKECVSNQFWEVYGTLIKISINAQSATSDPL